MRKVGVRQFQQKFHKELKDLPFLVTKNDEDCCIVASPNIKVINTFEQTFDEQIGVLVLFDNAPEIPLNSVFTLEGKLALDGSFELIKIRLTKDDDYFKYLKSNIVSDKQLIEGLKERKRGAAQRIE